MEIESQFKASLGRLLDSLTSPIVVAVSTGVDSMVLLTLLQRLPEIERTKLIVAHVNHELRAQSVAEETYLTDYCRKHQLKLVKAHWPKQIHPANGIEAAARSFRYQFF
ncbi:ATP-binding protein [Secundilactobacillus odoratitofui]|nr:ATP-binding protein [Secundilactobacillus odoratitofui]